MHRRHVRRTRCHAAYRARGPACSPRPGAASTSTTGNGQRRPQVDQSHRIILTLTQRHAGFDITLSHGKVEENAHRAAVLDGIPVRWVTVLRGSELGVLRGRQSRHIRHRSDMTKLAGVDHSADRLTTPSATSSSTTLTTRPLASYNTALGWPSTQASRIQAPRTRQAEQADEQPHDALPPGQRLPDRLRLAAAVPTPLAPSARGPPAAPGTPWTASRPARRPARRRAGRGHDDRLGQPVPHVRLPLHPRRPQVVDAQPRHHGRQVRLRIGDRGSRPAGRVRPRNASCTTSSASPTEPVIP